jgi:hypothetical protein
MSKTELFKTRPAGVGNIGRMGEGIDVDWAAVHGGRALRRFLAKHEQRQITKAAVNGKKPPKSKARR